MTRLAFLALLLLAGCGKSYVGPLNIGVRDTYYTANRFYGGQLGFNAEAQWGHCYLGTSFKLALGYVHQHVNIDGVSTLNDPATGTSSAVRGGLYANASNIGVYTNDEFTVLPELEKQIS